ncbi:uncharacterized protein C2orf42 homolog isoform X2 [Mauremys mutica]|uniref:uncharacterized protein C2orf42 homolog isoform X2 n=1 Tax=Mauremys mutica TaxID=74926 RepID=UPI001D163750|nr:uncharacterized protein C2orf42 homolog isoform X2 [Mauremys mutica]
MLWLSDASGRRLLPAELLQQPKPSKPTFVRKDALPSVTFSKYTWHITNILQVKQIFDTPEMPLEITRSFIQNRDGTYELFKCPKVEVESIAETYECLDKQPILWPLELKTFLKVGTTRWRNTRPDRWAMICLRLRPLARRTQMNQRSVWRRGTAERWFFRGLGGFGHRQLRRTERFGPNLFLASHKIRCSTECRNSRGRLFYRPILSKVEGEIWY